MSQRCRRPSLTSILVVAGALIAAVGTGHAQTEAGASADAYTVPGVAVDVTAASAAEARDKAIQEGQRKAFGELFRTLTGGAGTAPAIGDNELSRLVQAFEIEDERASAVRYVASLTFHFRPDRVRSYVSGTGAKIVASPTPGAAPPGEAPIPAEPGPGPGPGPAAGPSVVVLAVTDSGGRPVLWEDRTAWRAAWEDRTPSAGAANLVVPVGDLADVADIGAKEALNGATGPIAKIAQRYGAAEVIVAVLDTSESGGPVAVKVSRYGRDGLLSSDTVPVATNPGDGAAEIIRKAVAGVVATLESSRRDDTARAAVTTDLTVTVPIAVMADWLETRRRLASVSGVSGVTVLSLSRTRGELSLHFRGDAERLRSALAARDLSLVPPEGGLGATPGLVGGGWQLRLGAGAIPGRVGGSPAVGSVTAQPLLPPTGMPAAPGPAPVGRSPF